MQDVHLNYSEGQEPDLYVFADFMKAEATAQTLTAESSPAGRSELTRTFVPKVRVAEMPQYLPQAARGSNKAVFDKDKSVFRPWVEDTPSILRQALARDLGCWKVPKMIGRDPGDLKECTEIISRQFPALKRMFVRLQCGDNYPYIGWAEFR